MGNFKLEDKLLAWAGFLCGLPSFITLFAQGQIIVATLVLLLLVAIIWVLYLRRENSLPDYETIQVKKKVEISNVQGTSALLEHIVEIKANRAIKEFWISGIDYDGSVNTILIDGTKPNQIKPYVGQLMVKKEFPPLRKGETRTIKLTMNVKDCFLTDQEFFEHGVISQTGSLEMTVKLPPGRPAKQIFATVGMGGQPKEGLKDIETSADKLELRLVKRNPELGSDYRIIWEW